MENCYRNHVNINAAGFIELWITVFYRLCFWKDIMPIIGLCLQYFCFVSVFISLLMWDEIFDGFRFAEIRDVGDQMLTIIII